MIEERTKGSVRQSKKEKIVNLLVEIICIFPQIC